MYALPALLSSSCMLWLRLSLFLCGFHFICHTFPLFAISLYFCAQPHTTHILEITLLIIIIIFLFSISLCLSPIFFLRSERDICINRCWYKLIKNPAGTVVIVTRYHNTSAIQYLLLYLCLFFTFLWIFPKITNHFENFLKNPFSVALSSQPNEIIPLIRETKIGSVNSKRKSLISIIEVSF